MNAKSEKMILIIGDSNYRNTLDKYGEQLSLAVGEKINFILNSTNETMRVALETAHHYKIIVVTAPLNEIAHRVKTGGKKGRDETIKNVIEEQNKLINVSAIKEGRLGVIHLLMPPIMRQEPAWMEERHKLATFYCKDFIASKSPWNVGIGNPIEITAGDLTADKVHLNDSGMEKLFKGLEKDIKKCKENLGEGDEPLSQDWASQVMEESANEPPTPGNIRKRVRPQVLETSEEEEEEQTGKKQKKNSAEDKMDKIYQLVKEMKDDNKTARAEVLDLKDKVVTTDKKVEDLKVEFDGFKGGVARETELTAEMREDIDGLENENLKNTVIVRKLKAVRRVPTDKKELRTYIQDLSRDLVNKVLGPGSGGGVRYAAMLYATVDPTKKDNKVGLVPPFKICFTRKDQGVAFRDKAVGMAKVGQPKRTYGADADGANEGEAMEQEQQQEPGLRPNLGPKNVCQGAYFTFYQTAATRFRVTLMWAVADALKTGTKQVWVNQSNKPTLQVKEGGRVIKSLTFVQTMTEYKEKISQKTLDDVKKTATKLYGGHLEQTFLVIKD